MGWVYKPESLIIGYAPLESRTKQWATESQIEGWFPPPGGERHGCKSLPDRDRNLTSEPLPTLNVDQAIQVAWTSAAKPMGGRRNGDVSLDPLPHRRRDATRCAHVVLEGVEHIAFPGHKVLHW